ncbi:DUF3309 family protein [Jeongeupia naejangsanensis]|uniref:DUF3309 domain-containing protein n=1 Tax=Jeongeupia naejangsanensis TaxID=613195 RepID=A0ABS2BQE8_9NEIS|nr:DUF3309 family protein [Jeongeupia naejangsanensis]MBM3117851.1 DUF3309 domain-containing protein [Jeongeupia naejangsanensis]
MSLGTILLIVLVLIIIGTMPLWPYSKNWGYGVSGLTGAVTAVVMLFLMVMGRL